jgi:hypothetical protein
MRADGATGGAKPAHQTAASFLELIHPFSQPSIGGLVGHKRLAAFSSLVREGAVASRRRVGLHVCHFTKPNAARSWTLLIVKQSLDAGGLRWDEDRRSAAVWLANIGPLSKLLVVRPWRALGKVGEVSPAGAFDCFSDGIQGLTPLAIACRASGPVWPCERRDPM